MFPLICVTQDGPSLAKLVPSDAPARPRGSDRLAGAGGKMLLQVAGEQRVDV
jgi:hypothetical protein